MTNLAAVSSDESTILILCTLKSSPTQFFLQCDQWFHDGLKILFQYLLLLERTFEWALYPYPRSLLFALHLDWSLNTSVDKKIKYSLYICELVFHFSLCLKISIFLSLVLFSLEMHNRSRKKLSLDKQSFEDVIWNFWCYYV